MKYAIAYTQYELNCASIEKGKTPLPAGSVYPVQANLMEIPSKYLIIDGGELREKTTAEKTAYADASAAAAEAAEKARQEAKALVLKTVENNFLLICDSVTGTTTHTKLGFAELQQIGSQITDPVAKTELTLTLLSIDAQAKTEGGMEWWEDCIWHPEIVD
jgi:hypothetical protein